MVVVQSTTLPAGTLWPVVRQLRSKAKIRPCPVASSSSSMYRPAACIVSWAFWWTMPTTFGTAQVLGEAEVAGLAVEVAGATGMGAALSVGTTTVVVPVWPAGLETGLLGIEHAAESSVRDSTATKRVRTSSPLNGLRDLIAAAPDAVTDGESRMCSTPGSRRPDVRRGALVGGLASYRPALAIGGEAAPVGPAAQHPP